MTTRTQIKSAMILSLNRGDCLDGGEINHTMLAETAALDCDHPEWLDDETHVVWDLAIDVADGWVIVG